MDLHTRSLRQKIFLGYITGVVLVIAFVIISSSNFGTLQEMVSSGESVSGLFDTTLEIRRFEKNFFLYRTSEDYQALLGYIDQADELLSQEELYLFATPQAVSDLRMKLREYSDLLKSDAAITNPDTKLPLEGQIREKGKEIVTAAEKIAANRSAIESSALQSAKRNLVIGVALILAAGLAGGLFLYSKAVKPLSVLEKHMNRISDGEFSLIGTRFKDRELVSLKAAFDKMLIELRERQKYLVQSEKLASLGTLVFGVAHEINNPLSNISTSSQILEEEIDSGDIRYKKELLKQIEAETDRARDVVASVLEFSRAREKRSFGLKSAVEQTIRFIKAEVPAGVGINVEISDDIKLYADRQKVQQVILNLIKNAMDAISGDGKITIHADYLGEQGENVGIFVRDNGAGMSSDQQSKIFDPFFTSKHQGYGLGLFIVHNIIQEHGGTISVESSPGRGTTFTIVMPARERQAEVPAMGVDS